MGWLQSQSTVLSQQRLNGSLLRKLYKESEEKNAAQECMSLQSGHDLLNFLNSWIFFPTCLIVVTFCSIKPEQLSFVLFCLQNSRCSDCLM